MKSHISDRVSFNGIVDDMTQCIKVSNTKIYGLLKHGVASHCSSTEWDNVVCGI